MNGRSLWKYVPPPGPVFSILLIGLVLLSAGLYYRAVKIQRFLEPALALSQPRNEFAKNINTIFQKEFGTEPISGLMVKSSSILIAKPRFFSNNGRLTESGIEDIQKLSKIFLALMQDQQTRSEISLVLIIARFPSYGPRGANELERKRVQQMVGSIQDALFRTEPELGIRYSTYFAGTAQPTNPHEGNRDLIELRIVPSEFLHIKVLDKLEKYSL